MTDLLVLLAAAGGGFVLGLVGGLVICFALASLMETPDDF